MIRTYNPREMKIWMEYSSILIGIFFIIWGIINFKFTLFILGFLFILVVSNKTEITISQDGLIINTTTLYVMKRIQKLSFEEMNSVFIKKASGKCLIYFIKGWKGRKVLIDTCNLDKSLKYVKSKKPDLIKED